MCKFKVRRRQGGRENGEGGKEAKNFFSEEFKLINNEIEMEITMVGKNFDEFRFLFLLVFSFPLFPPLPPSIPPPLTAPNFPIKTHFLLKHFKACSKVYLVMTQPLKFLNRNYYFFFFPLRNVC